MVRSGRGRLWHKKGGLHTHCVTLQILILIGRKVSPKMAVDFQRLGTSSASVIHTVSIDQWSV